MSMISEFAEKLRDRLKKELQLADEDKRKANVLQFDRAVGYANGMAIAIDILNQLAEEYKDVPDTNVGKWIPVSERLPDKEEYLKDDGRFIVTDGNRRYQCIYDIYQGSFRTLVLFTNGGIERGWNFEEDKCVIAWQPLPEPYKGEEK